MATSQSDILPQLITLAAKRFEHDAAALKGGDDFFATLGIDSLQALDLLTDLEDHFDLEIPDWELQGVTTFDALAAVIGRRL